MDLSKLQIIALVIITTILTNKFLYTQPSVYTPTPTPTPAAIILAPTVPLAQVSTSPAPSPLPTGASISNDAILKELIGLRKEMVSSLTELKQKSLLLDSSIGSSSTSASVPALAGMVKIKSPQWSRIDMFDKPQASSVISGSLIYGNVYFYQKKQDAWYLIVLDTGQSGWSQSQFLAEYP